MANGREPVAKMLAEILRDMGLLVLVFMPLDTALAREPVPTHIFVPGMIMGVALVVGGIVVERKRR